MSFEISKIPIDQRPALHSALAQMSAFDYLSILRKNIGFSQESRDNVSVVKPIQTYKFFIEGIFFEHFFSDRYEFKTVNILLFFFSLDLITL